MRRAGDVLATKECGNPLRCCEIAENLIIAGRYVIPDIVLSFATMLSKNCGRWCGYVMIFLKYFLQYGWIPAFLVNCLSYKWQHLGGDETSSGSFGLHTNTGSYWLCQLPFSGIPYKWECFELCNFIRRFQHICVQCSEMRFESTCNSSM